MNKLLLPKVVFKDMVMDEKKIELAYSRIFILARKNLITKKHLTNKLSKKYSKIHGKDKIFNDRGGSKNASS